ncbi:MAG: ferritin family protein [Ancalomicrobiaceae bacterium]|nr:ferritin family protein [Ancalomicrobiaceae bacterium]
MTGSTGRVPGAIASVGELLAVAHALEIEAATRYRQLADRMQADGVEAVAEEFRVLADFEQGHVDLIDERGRAMLGHAIDAASVSWEQPSGFSEADLAMSADFGPYQALAFAVRNEERAFAFYAYVAAEAENEAIRLLAEDLARDELLHAAHLRRFRRRAFRSDPPAAIEIPASLDELAALSRRWHAAAAAAHRVLVRLLEVDGETADAAVFRVLAAEEATVAAGEATPAVEPIRRAVEGLKVLEAGFERFAVIAERAGDEAVVAEAQRLAELMVERLARAGGVRQNALIADAARTPPANPTLAEELDRG